MSSASTIFQRFISDGIPFKERELSSGGERVSVVVETGDTITYREIDQTVEVELTDSSEEVLALFAVLKHVEELGAEDAIKLRPDLVKLATRLRPLYYAAAPFMLLEYNAENEGANPSAFRDGFVALDRAIDIAAAIRLTKYSKRNRPLEPDVIAFQQAIKLAQAGLLSI